MSYTNNMEYGARIDLVEPRLQSAVELAKLLHQTDLRLLDSVERIGNTEADARSPCLMIYHLLLSSIQKLRRNN